MLTTILLIALLLLSLTCLCLASATVPGADVYQSLFKRLDKLTADVEALKAERDALAGAWCR